MTFPTMFIALTILYFAGLGLAATYSVSQSVVGSDFFSSFNWEAIPDPTNGRVNYVDMPTAVAQNLSYASDDTFILRADDTTILDPNGPGRNSVRIRSNDVYTTHVAVFNIRHMPQGCGTWPAVWETNEANWPTGGEVDILEGVNDQGPNGAVLHTDAGCTMPDSRDMTGTATGDNCDGAATGNAGCGVLLNDARSYGPTFNDNGGGWYAMERTTSFIKIWFWSRTDSTVPPDVFEGSPTVDTDNWGTPSALFPNTSCDLTEHFDQHNIIVDLTLCGDWAGNVYFLTTCPSTCVDFVNNNPSGFTDAYFDFASITIYQ